MQHFQSEAWLDFARGTAASDARRAMEEHLSSCERCRKLKNSWAALAEFSKGEVAYAPPESAVRQAKANFSLARAQRKPAAMAWLVFDSLLQPIAQGVRSISTSPRQLLYRKGECNIDVRIEKKPEAARFSMVGQIVGSGPSGKRVHNIPVMLMAAGDLVEQTSTNRFGEFLLEFEPADDLQISFGVTEREPVVVQLPRLRSPRAGVWA